MERCMRSCGAGWGSGALLAVVSWDLEYGWARVEKERQVSGEREVPWRWDVSAI